MGKEALQEREINYSNFEMHSHKWIGWGGCKGKTTHLYASGPRNYLPSVYLIVMSHSVLERSVSWITPLHNGPSMKQAILIKKGRSAETRRHTCTDTDHAVHPNLLECSPAQMHAPVSFHKQCVSMCVCVKLPIKADSSFLPCSPLLWADMFSRPKTPRFHQFNALQAHFLPHTA